MQTLAESFLADLDELSDDDELAVEEEGKEQGFEDQQVVDLCSDSALHLLPWCQLCSG